MFLYIYHENGGGTKFRPIVIRSDNINKMVFVTDFQEGNGGAGQGRWRGGRAGTSRRGPRPRRAPVTEGGSWGGGVEGRPKQTRFILHRTGGAGSAHSSGPRKYSTLPLYQENHFDGIAGRFEG